MQKIALEKLAEIGNTVKLGNKCNAHGELTKVEEVRKWGIICYIENLTNPSERTILEWSMEIFK